MLVIRIIAIEVEKKSGIKKLNFVAKSIKAKSRIL